MTPDQLATSAGVAIGMVSGIALLCLGIRWVARWLKFQQAGEELAPTKAPRPDHRTPEMSDG